MGTIDKKPMKPKITVKDNSRLAFFSMERIGLQQELKHHPVLVDLLQKHAPDNFEMRLAEIAAYCGLILDGDYVAQDFDNICEICRHKLWSKRSPIILSGNSSIDTGVH